jgi:hypothetical protein
MKVALRFVLPSILISFFYSYSAVAVYLTQRQKIRVFQSSVCTSPAG